VGELELKSMVKKHVLPILPNESPSEPLVFKYPYLCLKIYGTSKDITGELIESLLTDDDSDFFQATILNRWIGKLTEAEKKYAVRKFPHLVVHIEWRDFFLDALTSPVLCHNLKFVRTSIVAFMNTLDDSVLRLIINIHPEYVEYTPKYVRSTGAWILPCAMRYPKCLDHVSPVLLKSEAFARCLDQHVVNKYMHSKFFEELPPPPPPLTPLVLRLKSKAYNNIAYSMVSSTTTRKVLQALLAKYGAPKNLRKFIHRTHRLPSGCFDIPMDVEELERLAEADYSMAQHVVRVTKENVNWFLRRGLFAVLQRAPLGSLKVVMRSLVALPITPRDRLRRTQPVMFQNFERCPSTK